TAIHYKSRKLQYAVVLQAICDADLHFIDCFTGYPGSVGDYQIFRNSQSDIYRDVNRNLPAFFPDDEFIIGDKAYPVLTWCIPPFRNNGRLTRNQNIFNRVISQKRQVIERAFALLKGRFRRLKFLDMSRLDLILFFIMAACVLHNIFLEGIDDDIIEFIEQGREPYDEENNDDDINDPEQIDRHELRTEYSKEFWETGPNETSHQINLKANAVNILAGYAVSVNAVRNAAKVKHNVRHDITAEMRQKLSRVYQHK
ncbi:uncharacterized protein, partial [Temnothorax nylanderi]|uniref:uncharacterized protein n=1 Tax=Temnothorax nylanderi TaxID=102681 RepID=UPI003A86CC3D